MLYWLDTGRACGGVIVGVSDGTVIDCAPIWRRAFMGRKIIHLMRQGWTILYAPRCHPNVTQNQLSLALFDSRSLKPDRDGSAT